MQPASHDSTGFAISQADEEGALDAVKALADRHRWELGFHARQAFEQSAARRELLIAKLDGRISGFIRYHHRQDHRTTIYEIVTAPEARGRGIARALLSSLEEECRRAASRSIRLSCPVELGANGFYAAAGFRQVDCHSRPGKNRPLFEWERPLIPEQPLVFVASLTACGADLAQMIRLWEAHGHGRPFQRCIITPLFTYPGAFEHVRYLHERWGVEVIFDSGGFFVQQEKIRYEELFARLMEFTFSISGLICTSSPTLFRPRAKARLKLRSVCM